MDRLDLSQTAVAARLSISDVAVSRWISGWRQPSPAHLVALAGIFGTTTAALTTVDSEVLVHGAAVVPEATRSSDPVLADIQEDVSL